MKDNDLLELCDALTAMTTPQIDHELFDRRAGVIQLLANELRVRIRSDVAWSRKWHPMSELRTGSCVIGGRDDGAVLAIVSTVDGGEVVLYGKPDVRLPMDRFVGWTEWPEHPSPEFRSVPRPAETGTGEGE